jgi:hypothetical protein
MNVATSLGRVVLPIWRNQRVLVPKLTLGCWLPEGQTTRISPSLFEIEALDAIKIIFFVTRHCEAVKVTNDWSGYIECVHLLDV